MHSQIYQGVVSMVFEATRWCLAVCLADCIDGNGLNVVMSCEDGYSNSVGKRRSIYLVFLQNDCLGLVTPSMSSYTIV